MGLYLLVSSDFKKTGGQDRANYALAEFLARHGDEVHLVAHYASDSLLKLPGVIFHRAPLICRSYFLSEPLLAQLGRHWAKKISARGGKVLLNGGNCSWPAVNWAHYVHAAYAPQASFSALGSLQVALYNRVYRGRERDSFRKASRIIADSNFTAANIAEHCGIPTERITTVYYGVDAQIFRPFTEDEKLTARRVLHWDEQKPYLLFAGALGDRRKGFDLLFAAWQELCADPAWNAELAVAGAGRELKHWQQAAQAAGLARRIHFLGFRKDIPQLLCAADALVSPVRYEPYGLNVHEALCCARPAFVSSTAGAAERYPAELKDLLFEKLEDPAEIAAKLRHYLSCPAPMQKHLLAFSSELRAYSWEEMARRIKDVLDT